MRITPEQEQAILRLRTQDTPASCRETARQVGCSEATVWNVLHRHGLDGRTTAKPVVGGRPPRKHSITSVIAAYGSVYIETGLNGGYIATLGEAITGAERETVLAAVRSAAGMDSKSRQFASGKIES